MTRRNTPRKKTKKKAARRSKGWLIGLVVLLALAILLSLGKRGFIQQIRSEKARDTLAREIQSLEQEKARLEEEKENLKTPEYTEKVAREKYGMAKKNEKVYQIVPQKSEK